MVFRVGVAPADEPRFASEDDVRLDSGDAAADCTPAGADMTRAADALTDLPQSMQKRAPS